MTVPELANLISTNLNRPPSPYFFRLPTKILSTVASWSTGAAQDYLETAYEAGAQAYISGEISERTVLESRELDTPLLFCWASCQRNIRHTPSSIGVAQTAVFLNSKFLFRQYR